MARSDICRINVRLQVCEDGLRWLCFTCERHGTQWREYAGGTTRQSCTIRASERFPVEQWEVELDELDGGVVDVEEA